MTVSSQTQRVSYAGDGSTTSFPVSFLFYSNADVSAILRATDGTETTWTENTQYTLTGAGNPNGGTLTVKTSPTDYTPASGTTLVIKRELDFVQETDLPADGAFPSESVERQLDRSVMHAQQLGEQIARSLTLPATTAFANLSLPEPASNQLLGWNAGATDLENKVAADIPLTSVTTFMQTLLDDATAAAARGTLELATSTTDHALVRFNGVSGKQQNSTVIIGDTGGISGVESINNNTLAGLSGWGNVIAPHEGLVVQSASVSTVDVDAAGVLVRSAAGDVRWLESVNLTVNITASGANGLDTGSEAALTWYYVYVIYNPTTDTTAGLLSASATSPTLPSGYTYSGLVGSIRNDGANDFIEIHQRGRLAVTLRNTPLSNGTATSYTAVSLIGAVPPIATAARGYLTVDRSAGTAAVDLFVATEGAGTSATLGEERASIQNAVTGFGTSAWELPLKTAQQVVYRVAGTSARGTITCSQWRY